MVGPQLCHAKPLRAMAAQVSVVADFRGLTMPSRSYEMFRQGLTSTNGVRQLRNVSGIRTW